MYHFLSTGRGIACRFPFGLRCVLFSDFSAPPPDTGAVVISEHGCNQVPSALKECTEDLSDYAPYHVATFNLAAYVNRSPTLRRLVQLGVSLHTVERTKGAAELILSLDFERDMQNHIRFLHDCGVPADSLGNYITRNPFIFGQDLENLEVRINYLCSKKFTKDGIARIMVKNPKWIIHSTEDIDDRLGYFQQNFLLTGPEVRFVAIRQPKLITYDLSHIRDMRFAVIEEMGFSENESKQIILRKPKIYTLSRNSLVARFDYIHNTMSIPHSLIVEQTEGLLSRVRRLQERHQFLALLGLNIYDPTSPAYVSLGNMVAGNDAQFCSNVAKTPVAVFNKFLKTL